ncbi:hypothetical protein TNCV_430221 [Trichonephila clavipes]|nr:hypothetical protein TNCV_430221 [Trichonephila clavipes]
MRLEESILERRRNGFLEAFFCPLQFKGALFGYFGSDEIKWVFINMMFATRGCQVIRDMNFVKARFDRVVGEDLDSLKDPSYGIDGDRFNSCQVIYSQFGLAIHQNDHQARRRFFEWAQNEIAVVPDFHKRILFSDEAHFWLNGYVNKQNCRIWSEANPQVYVETPLYKEKLTVWCALWAGGILLQKR